MKKTVFIDMYGVVIEESKGNFLPYTYSHFPECEHERITRLIRQDKIFTKASGGEISCAEFMTALGYDDVEHHIKDYIENHLTLDNGFIPFAEKNYAEYDFVLVSNDIPEWSRHITEYHGLDKYFKHKIVSGEVKCRKPDVKIFEIALEQAHNSPANCVFIDNSVKNIGVAKSLGITPVLFNRDKEEYCGQVANSFEELDIILRGVLK